MAKIRQHFQFSIYKKINPVKIKIPWALLKRQGIFPIAFL